MVKAIQVLYPLTKVDATEKESSGRSCKQSNDWFCALLCKQISHWNTPKYPLKLWNFGGNFTIPKDPFVCPKEGIISIILFWGWDLDHQSYSREGSGFLGYRQADLQKVPEIFLISGDTDHPSCLSANPPDPISQWLPVNKQICPFTLRTNIYKLIDVHIHLSMLV